MDKVDSSARGFSLMEVVTALSVISFALVALLGLFPVGLENSRICVGETRAVQLAQMVYSTLSSEPFRAAPCFGGTEMPPLDLSTLDNTGGEAGSVLYASYDARFTPQLARTDTPPPEAIYRIELRFHPENLSGSLTGRTTGSTVRLRVTSLNPRQPPIFESSAFLDSLQRVSFTE